MPTKRAGRSGFESLAQSRWAVPTLQLNRFAAAFAGADADAVVQRQDEDLAVADFAGLAGPAAA